MTIDFSTTDEILRMNRKLQYIVLGVLFFVMFILVASSSYLVVHNQFRSFESMIGRCEASPVAEVTRQGNLSIELVDIDELPQDAVDQTACLFDELQVPEQVLDQMGATSVMAGYQSANWDDYRANWYLSFSDDDVLNGTRDLHILVEDHRGLIR